MSNHAVRKDAALRIPTSPAPRRSRTRSLMPVASSLMIGTACLHGCADPGSTAAIVAGTTVAGTMVMGSTVGPELKQVIYLGSYDPQGQLPPEVYRITVRGQGSMTSGVGFASGWVPAIVADALGSSVSIDPSSGGVKLNAASGVGVLNNPTLGTGRRMVLFGPDGFRVAPKDHRLVIVMGSNADAYFEMIDRALGDMGRLGLQSQDQAVSRAVLVREAGLDTERDELSRLIEKLQVAEIEDLRAPAVQSPARDNIN